jgi:hypothetical protein
MAKGKRKARTEAERAEIEADRIAAHGVSDSAGQNSSQFEVEDEMSVEELYEVKTPDEAIVGSNVQVGEFDEATVDRLNDSTPLTDEQDEELAALQLADSEEQSEDKPEEAIDAPNSVVKDKFKTKYIENAIAQGVTHKAAKRSNWDWLSQQIAAFCLNDKHSIDIDKFLSLLDANGVDHSKWTNRNRGWEGRLRMTGRVALQKVVAESGWLKFPDTDEASDISELAPPDWRAKYKAKG